MDTGNVSIIHLLTIKLFLKIGTVIAVIIEADLMAIVAVIHMVMAMPVMTMVGRTNEVT
jgi:hypothetical protein|tara:strand:- start:78 stop:254 length:177 start_codon:yes stop_codon:yes gene_type:complete